MIEAVMTFIVVALLVGVTAAVATRYPSVMRRWVWFALLEYLFCATAQLVYARVNAEGGDAFFYGKGGVALARLLDESFGWSARELLLLLLQQPSAFDNLVSGAGGNTGSMFAAAGWLLFFVRGSEYAVQVLVAGLSMMAALSIYNAFHEAYPEASSTRLFVATVMFPSVAFWTSALHKEAFCLMGMGALLASWRAVRRRKVLRALVYAPLGVVLILVFRAPALPPLLLGLVVYFVVGRIRKVRGADATVLGPVYLGLGLGVLAVSMVLVSRVSPALGLDQLGETVAAQRNAWAVSGGGSTFADEAPLEQSTGAQLARVPLALLNALFRPQLFDVNNPLSLISALEMTVITWMVIRAFRMHGIRGIVGRIQGSPFLLMCTVVTLVGCTFVGLVTLNFGSLARYRVPFLPFYVTLVAVLTERTVAVAAVRAAPRERPKQPLARRAARTAART